MYNKRILQFIVTVVRTCIYKLGMMWVALKTQTVILSADSVIFFSTKIVVEGGGEECRNKIA